MLSRHRIPENVQIHLVRIIYPRLHIVLQILTCPRWCVFSRSVRRLSGFSERKFSGVIQEGHKILLGLCTRNAPRKRYLGNKYRRKAIVVYPYVYTENLWHIICTEENKDWVFWNFTIPKECPLPSVGAR